MHRSLTSSKDTLRQEAELVLSETATHDLPLMEISADIVLALLNEIDGLRDELEDVTSELEAAKGDAVRDRGHWCRGGTAY